MKKLGLLIGVLSAVIVIGGAFLLSRSSSPTLPSSYEYFWGDGCPHCAVVEEFLSGWDKKDKVSLDKKEVWKNPANARLLAQRASSCKIPRSELGVPLLVTPEGKCIGGDTPIIDFLKNLEL